jgi:hypothetical protein
MAGNDSGSNVSSRNASGAASNANLTPQAMVEMIQQLQEQILVLERQAVSSVKIPQPEFFDGTRSKLRGFLTQLDTNLRINQSKLPMEADKVIYASTFLRGPAFDWFEPFLREYQEKVQKDWGDITEEVFSNYNKFKKRLLETFGDIDAKRTAERKLRRLRQNTPDVGRYAAEFQQVISHLDWDEDAYIAIFEDGLRDDVKDELVRIDRPESIAGMFSTAVRIGNRLMDRQAQRQETRQWRSQGQRPFGQYRQNDRRPRQQPPRPARYEDPYGPRPMELDATQEEQDERRKKNLCFSCGKPGHRSRECKQKRPPFKKQHLRATREELRATSEWVENWGKEATRTGTIAKGDSWENWDWAHPHAEEIRHEQIDYPEIDWDTVESQGWTQYVTQDKISHETKEDTEQPSQNEIGHRTVATGPEETQGHLGLKKRDVETTETRDPLSETTGFPGTPTTIPETPQKSPKYRHGTGNDEEASELVVNLREENRTNSLDQHLIAAIEEGDDPAGCPCDNSTCACTGYARHPEHGIMATIACYDETCTTHATGKLNYGIEPRPLRWMKKPKWKKSYQGIWYDGQQMYD